MSRPRPAGLSPSFRSLVLVGVIALLLLLVVGGLKGYRELSAARLREAELEARLVETRREIDRLSGRIERLRDDPALLEKLARDQLMMMKADEVVIVYPPLPAVEEPRPVAADEAPPPQVTP